MGTWSYTQGSGTYSCGDGQKGTVTVKAGVEVTFERLDRQLSSRAFDTCELPVELREEGVAPMEGCACTYTRTNPVYGAHTTTLTMATDSLWTVDGDGVLREESHQVFDVKYKEGPYHFVCDVRLVARAEAR